MFVPPNPHIEMLKSFLHEKAVRGNEVITGEHSRMGSLPLKETDDPSSLPCKEP